MSTLRLGVEFESVRRLSDALETIAELRGKHAAVPLFHARYDRSDVIGVAKARNGCFTRSDMEADSDTWSNQIIGKISQLDLDNPDAGVRAANERIARQEWDWASHLGVQAALFPTPNAKHNNYARFLNQICHESSHLLLWIRIPIVSQAEFCARVQSDEDLVDPWILWDKVRTQCDHHPRLGVALELTPDLPDNPKELERWEGEPVQALIFPTDIFLTNKKGFPCLSKAHQEFVVNMYRFNPKILVKGRPRHKDSYLPYFQYLDHLTTRLPPITQEEYFTGPYKDYLQAPLQPLMDNLESQTYETFEKDPIKYERYQAAIALALQDKMQQIDTNIRPVTVMVVGAGRGPLVAATLNASHSTNCPVKVYAVEKNPNAIITLSNRIRSERWTNVTLIASDMRDWDPVEKADVMVSELLGSFGDNELSPECLDGAQRLLDPVAGISIPTSYTSYLAPMMSHKIFCNAKLRGNPGGQTANFSEVPYVVKLFNHFKVDEEQPCFTFTHPIHPDQIVDGAPHDFFHSNARDCKHNERFTSLDFTIPVSCRIHGFAAYFESVLYKDVMISTAPRSVSEGMFSWFPMYFPIKNPVQIYLRPGEQTTLTLNMWRKTGGGKVWYEWQISEPVVSAVENVGGRTYWIGL